MAEYPYVLVPNRISTLFDQIRKVNRPAKASIEWLKQIGLTSSNDRAFVALLRSLGYIDPSGVPTERWSDLRGTEEARRSSIGRQMQVAYKEVFDGVPVERVATDLSKQELKNFVRPKVSAGDPTVDNIVATFFALRALASFDGSEPAPTTVAPPHPSAVSTSAPAAQIAVASGVSVTINLSLELPATSDADVYDKLFESMAKHLGGLLRRD